MTLVTPLYAALLAILFLGLSARVIIYRRGNLISLGDAGDKTLQTRIRAQANCAEYAPMGLLLLLLAELQGAPIWACHALGIMLVFGRIAHALGLFHKQQNMRLRVLGMGLTLTMILVSALLCIGLSIGA